MSYSACDFVDSIAGIVNATDAEIDQAAEHLGIGDEDSELSDDETFAAWSLAVCNRIERAINTHDELVAALQAAADDPMLEALSGETVAAIRAALSKAEEA